MYVLLWGVFVLLLRWRCLCDGIAGSCCVRTLRRAVVEILEGSNRYGAGVKRSGLWRSWPAILMYAEGLLFEG